MGQLFSATRDQGTKRTRLYHYCWTLNHSLFAPIHTANNIIDRRLGQQHGLRYRLVLLLLDGRKR